MAKLLKNETETDYVINDCGVTIAANTVYAVQSSDDFLFAASNDLLPYITSGDLIVNDGTNDLSASDGIKLIQGMFPSTVKMAGPTDSDEASLYRLKMAPTGWTYQLASFELTTSKLNSSISLDYEGQSRGDCTIKFYDADDVELTTQGSLDTDCIKTVIDFEPTFDYEIIGGFVSALTVPTTNIRLWVIGVPDIPAAYGGTKVMANGPNFKFKQIIETDGRVAKRMTYSETYHTNKIRFEFVHNVGLQHEFMINMEYYRL